MPTRHPVAYEVDPELGPVKRCPVCAEKWPTDEEFWCMVNGKPMGRCRACRLDTRNARPIPHKMTTHRVHGRDMERRREMERRRNRAIRQDPVFGERLRARQLVAQRRYYWRHHEACLERRRAQYAASLGRPVIPGRGRPRIAA